ncbi:pilus assembly protein PilZ [Vogesella sp. EB]|jgi:type IV pilus assembly protein PilZ|uniref:PilZ domain-containing protein n=1 Tax=Vogesella margarita TaxID=2984199 RepID=A0ABT5IQU9_9NEIS|nr:MULTISPECIES: PilZ domain-containing protein [Vogesella]KMJ52516.1 pilus assembly protein PilZ [Vogesella sp. EB]MCQ4146048.1 PilZ domain-containing protein [Vogesella sp. AC12]MDC7699171.1 PilZ domain-containing protein [Vogesella indigofera]MDC7702031.1 PilZ domain-containing protein [Vogesella indigofera]MDC7711307.1 PilZ domain-containing protein [Vogesella indigofera]
MDNAVEIKPDASRPGVLSLSIKERSALYAAYMPFLRNGGIFVPTNRDYNLGDEVFLLLTLLDDTQKLAIPGKVAWLTPAGANNNRNQGIGIEFAADETCKQARLKIESLLGGALNSTRPTHTM